MIPVLYTTIRNTSGAKLFCGFLGISGRNLNADQELSVFGSLVDMLRDGAFGFGSYISGRKAELEARLADGDVAIISTPSVVIFDSSSSKAYVVTATSDALALTQHFPVA